MTELLRVDHLNKHYPGFALQDVSFSVKPGRIMGLIGKNGAGKSTTLKSILNIVQPQSGIVSILGKDFYQNEKECKQEIGVVFGGIDFYPLKKLSTITAVTSRFYKDWDQNRYTEYLRQFSLDESKQFRTLSNGMKVKYLLALALSHHAKLYLLDEPTSGLHFREISQLIALLQKICDAGNTVVVIEHDMNVVASADWVIDMGPGGEDGGRILCEGTPEDIAACPESVTGRFLQKKIA